MSTRVALQPMTGTEVREMWMNLFDPESSSKLKEQIKRGLRTYIKTEIERHLTTGKFGDCRLSYQILPPNVTTAFVMTRGLDYINVYAHLNSISKSENFILIGYSSGMHSTDKKFKDGTSMSKKIFVIEEDLQTIKMDVSAPMLLLDEAKETGATFAIIGKALKHQLGYTGELWQAYGVHSFERWNGQLEGNIYRREQKHIQRNAPIVTEQGRVIPPTKTKKSRAKDTSAQQLLRNYT